MKMIWVKEFLAMRPHSWKIALVYPAVVLITTLLYGDIFVKTNGVDTGSGADWANAYATISNAVAQAGASTPVWVSNGIYNISAEILITNGITITGFGGQDVTTVQSPTTNCRIFQITNANAVLDGFTVCKGEVPSADKKGAGIYLAAGAVRNCTISNNAPTNTTVLGAGVFMSGGTLSNCLIRNNAGTSSRGAGVYITNNAIAMNCVIRDNGNQNGILGGGVYLATGGVVSNCVIHNNRTTSTSAEGAGVYMMGGKLQNSSIVSNAMTGGAWGNGGGVRISGGRIENCLIASNWCNGTYGAGMAGKVLP